MRKILLWCVVVVAWVVLSWVLTALAYSGVALITNDTNRRSLLACAVLATMMIVFRHVLRKINKRFE